MSKIRYRSGYKYQLTDTYQIQTSIRPESEIETLFIKLDIDGLLTIIKGYAWDGPSGPTVDTPNFMRGSLVHDAFYQLIRECFLNINEHKDAADRELQRICIEDGMSSIRAYLVYLGVKFCGEKSCRGDGGKTLCEAP